MPHRTNSHGGIRAEGLAVGPTFSEQFEGMSALQVPCTQAAAAGIPRDRGGGFVWLRGLRSLDP